jgi:hypothetical protein
MFIIWSIFLVIIGVLLIGSLIGVGVISVFSPQPPATVTSTEYKYELVFATTSTLQWIGEYTDQNEMLDVVYQIWNNGPTSTPQVETWICINYGTHLWRNPAEFPENQGYLATTTGAQTPESLGYSDCSLIN